MSEQRIAVVSGGGGHFGLAIVKQLLTDGLKAVILSSRQEKGDAARRLLPPELQTYCMALECDVSDPEAVSQAFSQVYQRLGSIDVVINGAGFTDRHTLDTITLENWDKAMKSALNGTFLMTREAVKYMEKKRHPRIINISSVEGRCGGVEAGIGTVTAKAGIIAFTKAAARELAGRGVTVNCIAIGAEIADTPRKQRDAASERHLLEEIPLGRLCTPEDVAPLAGFLSGISSDYMTGTVIDINGGLYMN